MFHAKNKIRLLPHSLPDRKYVEVGLKKLTKIVLMLVENWLNIRPGIGIVTYEGFTLMTTQFLINSEIIVSEIKERKELLSDYETASILTTKYIPELIEPGLNFVSGSIDTRSMENLKKISTFVLRNQQMIIMYGNLEAELTFENIDRIEAQMGFQLRNIREPKRLFKASRSELPGKCIVFLLSQVPNISLEFCK